MDDKKKLKKSQDNIRASIISIKESFRDAVDGLKANAGVIVVSSILAYNMTPEIQSALTHSASALGTSILVAIGVNWGKFIGEQFGWAANQMLPESINAQKIGRIAGAITLGGTVFFGSNHMMSEWLGTEKAPITYKNPVTPPALSSP